MDEFLKIVENTKGFSYAGYCWTGAIEYAIVAILHIGTIVFVLNIVTKDYSWVDRIWSLLPIAFAGHLLYYQVHCDNVLVTLRQWIMFGFITLWGLRLTYNFYRKGGYTSQG